MNEEECTNCVVHGWLQPDREATLLTCKNCESIQYCSNECQDEHWAKVHKHHCQYFADPTKNEAGQHKETDCSICLKAAEVGEASLKEADNPNYECIFKMEIPQSLIHPHPFPVTGQAGDIYEKGIIVLWQLVRKFKIIHPQLALNYHEEFKELETNLMEERAEIWGARKIFPLPEAYGMDSRIHKKIKDLDDKIERRTILDDAFKLWNIVIVVKDIVFNVDLIDMSKFLKDPLTDLSEDIRKILSEGLKNTTKYLTIASKILEALSTQVISYEDVLKIIGGGSLEQECSICSDEVDISSRDASVLFSLLQLGKFFCGSQECRENVDAVWDDRCRFSATLAIMWREREENTCDFCFKRTPIKQRGSKIHDIHRCRLCKTTMYCSQDCHLTDDQIHEKACKKDKEGRKKKMGGSARRKAARENIERMETEFVGPIYLEVLEKFKLKNANIRYKEN